MTVTEQRAIAALIEQGTNPDFAPRILEILKNSGFRLADERNNELAVRWVNVQERAVPPDADTIIRTITRTVGERSTTSTHWLDGLRSPAV